MRSNQLSIKTWKIAYHVSEWLGDDDLFHWNPGADRWTWTNGAIGDTTRKPVKTKVSSDSTAPIRLSTAIDTRISTGGWWRRDVRVQEKSYVVNPNLRHTWIPGGRVGHKNSTMYFYGGFNVTLRKICTNNLTPILHTLRLIPRNVIIFANRVTTSVPKEHTFLNRKKNLSCFWSQGLHSRNCKFYFKFNKETIQGGIKYCGIFFEIWTIHKRILWSLLKLPCETIHLSD